MRRHLIPLVAIGMSVLTLAGCTSSSDSKKTLTEVVTVTGPSPAATGTGGSITVISPVSPTPTATGTGTGSGTAGGTTGSGATSTTPKASTSKSSSKPTTSTSSAPQTTAKLVKVNPLKADCAALLDAQDIKKILGVTISTSVTKIVDVANADIGRKGLIRCRYGASSAAAAAPVSVALADYTSATLAKAQLKTTVENLGGTTSSTKVVGWPATVVISDGGLLLMNYGTWTLSVAVADKLVPNVELPKDLTQLATLVLLRILKNA